MSRRIVATCLVVLLPIVPAGGAEPAVTFKDRTAASGLKIPNSAACWADFNNDDWVDLCAGGVWTNNVGRGFAHRDARGNQPQSRLLKNRGPLHRDRFQDLGTGGVHHQESYASPAAGDFDNDGTLDLFFTTVYATASFGRTNHPVLLRGNGQFGVADVTAAAGLSGLPPTYQAAWADVDNDGDLDLVTAGRLFVNQGTGRHWIKVRLLGDGSRINRSAIGAQVRITLGKQTLTRQVEAGTGEGNQNDPALHFGLGQHRRPVDLKIDWPGGRRQTVRGLQVDRLHVIRASR